MAGNLRGYASLHIRRQGGHAAAGQRKRIGQNGTGSARDAENRAVVAIDAIAQRVQVGKVGEA